MLGQIAIPLYTKFPFSRLHYTVSGGPFHDCPTSMVGVKMAKEIQRKCAVSIPTADFQTPDAETLAIGLDNAVRFLLKGQPLYVGCMGGKGRTGLFLAVLAKAFGVKQPVEYVRKHYYVHAVETPEQYRFVQTFAIPRSTRRQIARARRWTWLRLFSRRYALTRLPGPETVVLGSPEDRANLRRSQRAEAAAKRI